MIRRTAAPLTIKFNLAYCEQNRLIEVITNVNCNYTNVYLRLKSLEPGLPTINTNPEAPAHLVASGAVTAIKLIYETFYTGGVLLQSNSRVSQPFYWEGTSVQGIFQIHDTVGVTTSTVTDVTY